VAPHGGADIGASAQMITCPQNLVGPPACWDVERTLFDGATLLPFPGRSLCRHDGSMEGSIDGAVLAVVPLCTRV